MYSITEIAGIVSRMYSFTYCQSCTNYEGRLALAATESDIQAGFEDDVVEFIDVADILKSLKWRKRFVFIARCIGLEIWEIAEILKKNERTIRRDFEVSKNILSKMSTNDDV